ncbi:ATP-dependent metallopeptidase FtsH/Yme1/Tma family protein, partial [Acinetobacter baumannii]
MVSLFSNFAPQRPQESQVAYSQFLKELDQGNVTSVTVENRVIHGLTQNNQAFSTYIPLDDPFLLPALVKQKVIVRGKPPEQQGLLMH